MIRQIQISNFGSIHEDLIIECGQLTLIRGGNGSGKSMILNAIALALAPYGPLPRTWCWDNKNRGHVRLNIINPVLGDLIVDRYFRISKNSNRFIENVTVINGQERQDIGFLQNLIHPFVFEAFGLENSIKGSRNFLRYCSRLLGFRGHVHNEALKHIAAIFEQVNRRSERYFREVTLQDEELWLQHWDEDLRFPLEGAGGGDLAHLISDFALELAVQIGEYRNVLFLLDNFPTQLNPIERFARRYRQLSVPGMQAIMTTLKEVACKDLNPDVTIELANYDSEKRSNSTRITKIIRSSRSEIALIEKAIREFENGHEDEFIETLVIPMLTHLKFKGVRQIPHHGPGELGFDIELASREIFPGRIGFFGFQVKAGRVHARSSGSGNITELISQIRKMLSAQVLDPVSQNIVRVDYAVAIISQHLGDEAKRLWESEFEGERRVLLWEASTLANIIFEAGIWPRLPISFRIKSS